MPFVIDIDSDEFQIVGVFIKYLIIFKIFIMGINIIMWMIYIILNCILVCVIIIEDWIFKFFDNFWLIIKLILDNMFCLFRIFRFVNRRGRVRIWIIKLNHTKFRKSVILKLIIFISHINIFILLLLLGVRIATIRQFLLCWIRRNTFLLGWTKF